MKKNLLLVTFLLLMILICTGCSDSWENHFEISKFKINNNQIDGKIKNKDDKAYDLELVFNLKSVSLVEQKKCHTIIKPNETIDLDCSAVDYNDFDVNLSEIIFKEKEIPILSNGKINKDVLEYHFYNVFKKHEQNFMLFTVINDEFYNKHPYMDIIEYKEDEKVIHIEGTVTKDEDYFSYKVNYDSYTGEIENIEFFFKTKNEELKKEFINNIAIASFYSIYKDNSKEILEILNEDMPEDKCHIFNDKWCISSIKKDENIYYYYINKL